MSNILKLLDIGQSTFFNENLSINIIISDKKRNTDYFTKTPFFKPTFRYQNTQLYNKNSLQGLIFKTLKLHRKIEQLAELLLKYPMAYATSKFDVEKINLPLHFPLKPDTIFKKQRASKVHNDHSFSLKMS